MYDCGFLKEKFLMENEKTQYGMELADSEGDITPPLLETLRLISRLLIN